MRSRIDGWMERPSRASLVIHRLFGEVPGELRGGEQIVVPGRRRIVPRAQRPVPVDQEPGPRRSQPSRQHGNIWFHGPALTPRTPSAATLLRWPPRPRRLLRRGGAVVREPAVAADIPGLFWSGALAPFVRSSCLRMAQQHPVFGGRPKLTTQLAPNELGASSVEFRQLGFLPALPNCQRPPGSL